VLTLPVSSATSERAFSAMKIVKTRLRTTMCDQWMVDLLVIYIERVIAKAINVDDIVKYFMDMSSRRVLVK
jgi:hypothetical protein